MKEAINRKFTAPILGRINRRLDVTLTSVDYMGQLPLVSFRFAAPFFHIFLTRELEWRTQKRRFPGNSK